MSEKEKKFSAEAKTLIVIAAAAAAMAAVSYATAAAAVPCVKTATPVNTSLNYEIKGTALVSASEENTAFVEPDYRITDVFVAVGDEVKADDPLFSYNADDIAEELERLKTEADELSASLGKAELENSRQTLSDGLADEEETLKNAEKALKSAQTDLDETIKQWQDELKKESEQLREEYDSAVKSDSAVVTARRNLEDAQAAYDIAEKMMFEDETAFNAARTALDRAKRDLRSAENSGAEKCAKLRENAEEAERKYKESLSETIENSTPEGRKNDKLSAVRKAAESAAEEVENSKKALEKKKEILSAEEQNGEIDEKLAQTEENLLRKKLAAKNKQIAELDGLYENGGTVTAQTDGIVTRIDAQKGLTSSGVVTIAPNEFVLKGRISADDLKEVEAGDTISFRYKKGEDETMSKILTLGSVGADGTAEFTAEFGRKDGIINTSADFVINENIGTFYTCLPYSALHIENNRIFVYVVREKEGILGTELYAEEIPVTIKAKNADYAAVDGVSGADKVIYSSEKLLKRGDKVRYYDD